MAVAVDNFVLCRHAHDFSLKIGLGIAVGFKASYTEFAVTSRRDAPVGWLETTKPPGAEMPGGFA
jgi:hypothetical protein